MSEGRSGNRDHRHGGESPAAVAPIPGRDEEIAVRPILIFGGILALIVVLSLAAMMFLVFVFRSRAIAVDPQPSPLREATEARIPPEPRLQSSPPVDMRTWRAEETAAVDGYGWVDQRAGIARIPISRAMEIVLEKGLPEIQAPAAPGAASAEPARGRR